MGKRINKTLLRKIALRLKELRQERKITQEVFYNDTGINIGRIETAKRDISVSTLKIICDYLEISYQRFFLKGFD